MPEPSLGDRLLAFLQEGATFGRQVNCRRPWGRYRVELSGGAIMYRYAEEETFEAALEKALDLHD